MLITSVEFFMQNFLVLIKDIHYLSLWVTQFMQHCFVAVFFLSRIEKYQVPQMPRVMSQWKNAQLYKLNLTWLNSGHLTQKWWSFLNEITMICGRVRGLPCASLARSGLPHFPKAQLTNRRERVTCAYHRSVDVPECSLLAIEDLPFDLVSLLVHSVSKVTMDKTCH